MCCSLVTFKLKVFIMSLSFLLCKTILVWALGAVVFFCHKFATNRQCNGAILASQFGMLLCLLPVQNKEMEV